MYPHLYPQLVHPLRITVCEHAGVSQIVTKKMRNANDSANLGPSSRGEACVAQIGKERGNLILH
jgi:hypothetical protein